MRFIKIFSGYAVKVEREINEMSCKRNFDIISISSCINQGTFYVTVVFEKKEV